LERRRFLTSSLAASAFALANKSGHAQTPAPSGQPRQYYELRKYFVQQGPQSRITGKYVSDVLIPALNRLGITPVGAFNLEIGPETPTLYLLLPSTNLETLVTAELRLRQDEQFLAAAAPFWNAPESSPAFTRIESTLLIAFEGWPQLVVPPPTAQHGKRVFQLRSYESASYQDHIRKVEMFHSGEFEIFRRAGFWDVFFGDALIGPRLPNLTYMVSFEDEKQMKDLWDAFGNDPQWKKLTSSPRFNFEPIVNNVSNLILTPTSYSQV
jgi:NIPSNAP